MAKAERLAFLEKTDLFGGLPPALLNDVAEGAEMRAVAAGEYLFREGDAAEYMFVVQSGALVVLKESGGAQVRLRQMLPLELGGLTSMTTVKTRSASLRALQDSAVLTVARDIFLGLLEQHPQLATALIAHLSAKVRAKTGALAGALRDQGDEGRTRVAFFDAKPYERTRFAALAGDDLELAFFEARLGPETARLAEGSRAVCAFVNDDLSGPVLDQLSAVGVQLIALRCAGYNNVDRERAAEHDLTVVRVPAYSPYAVAEHAVALLLTLNRKTHRAHNRVREGNFRLDGLVGFDLHGRTAGIVGLGKIGKCLADILLGFGMQVVACDAYPDLDYAAERGVRFVELDELLAASDVVSLHAPLTPETHHLLDAARIARMKAGAVLINTGRGGLVDTEALIEALKRGHIGAAGLDVYEEESEYFFQDRSDAPITDDVLARLMTFNNVLVTSHQAFLTEEALGNIAATTVANVREFLAGRRGAELTNAVAL